MVEWTWKFFNNIYMLSSIAILDSIMWLFTNQPTHSQFWLVSFVNRHVLYVAIMGSAQWKGTKHTRTLGEMQAASQKIILVHCTIPVHIPVQQLETPRSGRSPCTTTFQQKFLL